MKIKILIGLLFFLSLAASGRMKMAADTAQKAETIKNRHMMNGMNIKSGNMPGDTTPKKPRPGYHIMNGREMKNSDMGDMEMNDLPMMSHAYSRNLPMTRDGSGTGWLPDASPMYAYMLNAGDWGLMLHGAIYPRVTAANFNNSGKRGQGSKFDAPNWFMGMAQHKAGKKGLFSFNLMMSADRLTEGGYGYPLLFQSGESWNNIPLHDRQHPHDLFSELAIAYTYALNKNTDLTAYAGYPGEPAIGPVAFMHRPSAMNNPDATLSHHWQDATHITFGVVTLGFRYKIAKLEFSAFNGQEPNEERFGFDEPHFNSYSYRISVNPNKELALQFSQAQINSPEALNPQEDIFRTTASVIYQHNFNEEKYLSNSLVWGHNQVKEHYAGVNDASEHAITAESNLQIKANAVYVRYEFVQKTDDELSIPSVLVPAQLFNVNAFTLGVNRRLFQHAHTDVSIGVQATLNAMPSGLNLLYGNSPLNGQIYLKINPSLIKGMR